MTKYPIRKPTRLTEYDYSQSGYYHVTACAYERGCIFGDIIDGCMRLNNAGQMVSQTVETLPKYYPDITIDNYIIMPNHIHMIIQITNTVGDDLSPEFGEV
ncbi:MAG: hypothetical protein V1933_02590 [Candidatus Omnitrophota bacterium]